MIRLIKPYISYDEVEDEFREIIDSGMLTKGKYSKALPNKMCEYTGAKYAINTTSATTALSASLEALGVKAGDEVIVSDFSFPATSNVVEACGATTVFADVSLDTYNMLPEELEKKITDKTKAVIFVCALGNPSGITDIYEICKKNNIPLINDAACAIGSSINGIKVGNITDIECFSFHPRKLLTGGEGGAITTNSDKISKILDVKLQHGATVTDGKMDFVTYGYNYRLSEIQCVMILKQLEKLDDIVERRIAIQREYINGLEPLGFTAQKCDENVVHNIQSMVFTVPNTINRDSLIKYLSENDVESVLGTYCLSNCSYFREKYNDVQPNALWLEGNTITLPCYDGVEVNLVVNAIKNYCEG